MEEEEDAKTERDKKPICCLLPLRFCFSNIYPTPVVLQITPRQDNAHKLLTLILTNSAIFFLFFIFHISIDKIYLIMFVKRFKNVYILSFTHFFFLRNLNWISFFLWNLNSNIYKHTTYETKFVQPLWTHFLIHKNGTQFKSKIIFIKVLWKINNKKDERGYTCLHFNTWIEIFIDTKNSEPSYLWISLSHPKDPQFIP